MSTDHAAQPTLPAGLPDDWRLDRDLPCPECRYNLRTLHTPRCPECGLVYRWQAILHIGCPRCGESLRECDAAACPNCRLTLDWALLLGSADPRTFKLYEYAEHPARAAIRTWFAVLRPRRFWRDVAIEVPPAPVRLRNLIFACLLLGSAGWIAFYFVGRHMRWSTPRTMLVGISMMLVPPIATAIMLPVFTDTLARFRIRRGHLLRCAAYGFSGMIWTSVAVMLIAVAVAAFDLILKPTMTWTGPYGRTFSFPVMTEIEVISLLTGYPGGFMGQGHTVLVSAVFFAAILGFAFLWWPYFFFVTLRSYLRLNERNSAAIFISTQIISLLVILFVISRDDTLLRAISAWML